MISKMQESVRINMEALIKARTEEQRVVEDMQELNAKLEKIHQRITEYSSIDRLQLSKEVPQRFLQMGDQLYWVRYRPDYGGKTAELYAVALETV